MNTKGMLVAALSAATLFGSVATSDNNPGVGDSGTFAIGRMSASAAFHDDRVVSLLDAALDGDAQKAKQLAAAGANVNAMGDSEITPLLWAMAKQNVQAVSILLDLGADPNEYKTPEIGVASLGTPPVWTAARIGEPRILQLLLDHGGDGNKQFGNETPLLQAIAYSHIDCAQLLLDRGADINWSTGPITALFETMVDDQFGDAVWVLKHGYTHDPVMAKRVLEHTRPRPGQEQLKVEALAMVDALVAALPPVPPPNPLESPDHQFLVVQSDFEKEDSAGNDHQLSLKTQATGKSESILSYPRDADVLWSPDSSHIAITNHMDSTYSTCLLYDVQHLDSPVDVGALIKQSPHGQKTLNGSDHLYMRCDAWPAGGLYLTVKVDGYNDDTRTQFSDLYNYSLKDRKLYPVSPPRRPIKGHR